MISDTDKITICPRYMLQRELEKQIIPRGTGLLGEIKLYNKIIDEIYMYVLNGELHEHIMDEMYSNVENGQRRF